MRTRLGFRPMQIEARRSRLLSFGSHYHLKVDAASTIQNNILPLILHYLLGFFLSLLILWNHVLRPLGFLRLLDIIEGESGVPSAQRGDNGEGELND